MSTNVDQLSVNRINLTELFGNQNEFFKIPHYQRKYAWEDTICQVLIDDILEVANAQRTTHFFSNLTLSPLDKFDSYYVVDGQQRVTTLSLFLAALQTVLAAEGCWELNKQFEKYLKNAEFLKLSFEDQVDQRTYRYLLLGHFCEPESRNDNMVNNFQLFKTQIEKNWGVLRTALCNGLFERLLFIRVVLPETMAAQRVFERMNGTKIKASQMDLIKNFLLMETNKSNEDSIYRKLETNLPLWEWHLRVLVCMNAQENVSEENVYKKFKAFRRQGPASGSAVDQFVEQLGIWIQCFGKVLKVFGELNGNSEMHEWEAGRYGPLLMKIAIVFSSSDDEGRRNTLIAHIVAHLRGWIAAYRLDSWKFHRQSWDASTSYKCLKKSGQHYEKRALEAAIEDVFSEVPEERINASVRNWAERKLYQEGYIRNASIIGILDMVQRCPDVKPDVVVQAFYQSFEGNKKNLGIEEGR